jgi:phospholipid-binding lipoprotein MlaA
MIARRASEAAPASGTHKGVLGTLALCIALASTVPVMAEVDPWEGANRKIYGFNDRLDRWVLKPVARGYDRVVPSFVKRGVRNFFTNIGEPIVAVNQLLQGEPCKAAEDTGRFLLNSTVGIFGLVDVAAANGLPPHDEDFGQTFVVWGVPNGRFITIPFRGPATVTHAGGMVLDLLTNPFQFISPARSRYFARGVDLIDARAGLLPTESLITGDRYLFLRDAYLQNREFLINDGVVEDDPFLDEFDEDYE